MKENTKQPMGWWGNKIGDQAYLETNKNGNTIFQSLWNAAKTVLRGKFMMIHALREKFITIHAYLKKQKKIQNSNQTLYLKKLIERTNNTQRRNSKDQSKNKLSKIF